MKKTEGLEKLAGEAWRTCGAPGLAVAAGAGGSIVFSQAYGKSDLEAGVAMTQASRHRMASLSKPVTGTILMGLARSGRVRLDDAARKYLPELPPQYAAVTLRHLLCHQGGVRGYRSDEEVFRTTHFATSREALVLFMYDPLEFEPGTRAEYSTFGFTVLGAIAEQVEQRSFEELSQRFFADHGVAGFATDNALAIVPGRVRGYLVSKDRPVENARPYDASNKYPAGGFVASAEDYLKFMLAVGGGRVLPLEAVQEMWTPQKLLSGAGTPFGLGWGVGQFAGNRMVGFNGLQPGSETKARYLPDRRSGAVVACNAEGAAALDKLADAVLGEVAAR